MSGNGLPARRRNDTPPSLEALRSAVAKLRTDHERLKATAASDFGGHVAFQLTLLEAVEKMERLVASIPHSVALVIEARMGGLQQQLERIEGKLDAAVGPTVVRG